MLRSRAVADDQAALDSLEASAKAKGVGGEANGDAAAKPAVPSVSPPRAPHPAERPRRKPPSKLDQLRKLSWHETYPKPRASTSKPHQIILRPLVTEKGMHKASRNNAYAFEVSRMAGKDDVRGRWSSCST